MNTRMRILFGELVTKLSTEPPRTFDTSGRSVEIGGESAPARSDPEGYSRPTKGVHRRGQSATSAAARGRAQGVLRPLDRPAVHHRLRRRVQARERGVRAPLGVSDAGALP